MHTEYKKNNFNLKKLSVVHFEKLSLLFQDEKMKKMAKISLPNNPAERAVIFQLWMNNPLIYVIFHKNDLIGMIGFYPWYEKEGIVSSSALELGYCLRPDQWGKHIMPDALKILLPEVLSSTHYLKIYAQTEISNIQSLKVLKKINFVIEKKEDGLIILHFSKIK
ncbi:GNAT family N-acetyltransferase [Paucilactobacillus sp. N302-9]